MRIVLVALVLASVFLSGCVNLQAVKEKVEEGRSTVVAQSPATRILYEEIPGFGTCAFLWAKHPSNDGSGGLALVGCK